MQTPILDEVTIRELEPLLRRLALRAVRDAAVASDLVQSTFLAAIEPASTFDAGRGNVRGFLVGILMRKAADHFRRQRRARVSGDLDENLESVTERVSHDPRHAMHPADRRRAMTVVEEALGRLPELQRLAVLACDIEQLERDEVARTLEVSEGNLRILLHRGRHQIRKALEDAGMR